MNFEDGTGSFFSLGAGFLVSTFLVQPFLPAEESIDKGVLCNIDR